METDKVPFTKQLGIMLKAKPVVVFYLFKITSSIAFVIKGSVTGRWRGGIMSLFR